MIKKSKNREDVFNRFKTNLQNKDEIHMKKIFYGILLTFL